MDRWSSLILRIVQLLGVDKAVAYTLASRGWQILAGLITIIGIGYCLTPIQQGFYYTFASILALQVFFELGLTYVILQFTAHEKAYLEWTEIRTLKGNIIAKERISQLIRLALHWYGVAAFLMIVIVTPIGWAIFSKSPDSSLAGTWQIPWLWLVVSSSSSLFISPIFATLEGCGLVADVARLRTIQDIFAYSIFWLLLFSGTGLFAVPVLQTTRVIISSIWLCAYYWNFITDLIHFKVSVVRLDWWKEVWPMQWKIALSWVSGYFIFNLFNPVLFAYFGAVEAGKMGMSLSIAGSLNLVCMTWVNTKIPTFGELIALKKYVELDRLFFKVLKIAFIASVICSALLLFILVFLKNVSISNRVLGPAPFSLLLATSVINIIIFSQAAYLRAYKKEPFLLNSVIGAVVTAIICYILGRTYGAEGMAYGQLLVTLILGLTWATWVFVNKRKAWNISVQ